MYLMGNVIGKWLNTIYRQHNNGITSDANCLPSVSPIWQANWGISSVRTSWNVLEINHALRHRKGCLLHFADVL